MEVINLYKDNTEDSIYIGRENKNLGFSRSILANPFPVKQHGLERCLELYKLWLWEKLDTPEILDYLLQLPETSRLACYCKPKDCHGDIIISCVEYLHSLGETEAEIKSKLALQLLDR